MRCGVLTSSFSGGRFTSIHSDMPTRTRRWTIHPAFPQTMTRSWSTGFAQRLITISNESIAGAKTHRIG